MSHRGDDRSKGKKKPGVHSKAHKHDWYTTRTATQVVDGWTFKYTFLACRGCPATDVKVERLGKA